MPSFDYVQNKLASKLKDNKPPYPRVKTISASPGEDEKYVYIEEEKSQPISISESEYKEFRQTGKIKRLVKSDLLIDRPTISKASLAKPHNTASVGLSIDIEKSNSLPLQDNISHRPQPTVYESKTDPLKSNGLNISAKNKIIVNDKPKTENECNRSSSNTHSPSIEDSKKPLEPRPLGAEAITTPNTYKGSLTAKNIPYLTFLELYNILDTFLKLSQHEIMLLSGIIKLSNYGAIKKIPIGYKEADLINLPISKIKNAREGLAEKGLISFEFIQTEKGKKPTCHYILTIPWCM